MQLLLIFLFFFFYQGFLSRALTTHRTAGKGRGTIFYSALPLPPADEHSDFYFVPLQVRWLSHIFNCTTCIYQAATQWVLPPYRNTIWLIDDIMLIFCLFVELLIWFKVFVTAIWHKKPVTSNPHQLSYLYCKQTH